MVDSLNEETISEYKATFDLFDKDRDGRITPQELAEMIQKLGQKVNELEVVEMIQEVDLDGNGSVDFKEFLGLMVRKMKDTEIDDELLETFKVFDVDGNGFITADELRKIILTIGDDVSTDDVEDMIREADKDADGKISFEDFVSLMKGP